MPDDSEGPPVGDIGAPDYEGTRATYLYDVLAERDEWMTSAELAEATGVPKPTVRKALRDLLERGDVERRPRLTRTVGRKPNEYRVVDDA